MSWNHRVIFHAAKTEDDEDWYGIHEVYYNEDGTLRAYTENAIGVSSETEGGLTLVLDQMCGALLKPVLTPGDFG